MNLVASCAFGLEAVVVRELQRLGYESRITNPGQVEFAGSWEAVCHTNLWLRCADRVSVLLAEFPCPDFDTLFETTKAIAWEAWLPKDARIPVTGRSVKSSLTSVPAVQRTVKKAIVERLVRVENVNTLPEDGSTFRIHLGLRNNQARLTLDTTGPSLHKRGYREIATKAPLKETLAAALIQLSFWEPDRPLIDPFCGGGTIPIEAAMMGRNIAPGLARTFVCETWAKPTSDQWQAVRLDARSKMASKLPETIIGTDIHGGAVSLARRNAIAAGVSDDIHFQQKSFDQLSSRRQFGCVITNPPYGERLETKQMRQLYESMPVILRRLPTWSHFVLTAYPQFEALIGKQANRRRKLYNGRIECTYYQFHGPPPSKASGRAITAESRSELVDDDAPTDDRSIKPVFGGWSAKAQEQAAIFANRLRKRVRHLRRWPTHRGITCYRIYERDIPEIPLVVDRYNEDHLHVVEFERPHDRDLAQQADWLQLMVETAGEVMQIPLEQIFVKSRQRQRGTQQHQKIGKQGYEIIVREAGLRFIVNLSDYADTGLFLDHRNARQIVRDLAKGKRVLNLFAYTGAFSVYAAVGGASQTTTVDWSSTYLDWARRNFTVNDLLDGRHDFVCEDVCQYVSRLPRRPLYDLIVLDPPTFSNSKRTSRVWDVQRDHAQLLNELLMRLAAGGTIFFSSNFRRFKLDTESIHRAAVREISRQTIPEDFRNQRVHCSWLISHQTGT